jgi:hypothetical protein
MVINHFIKLSDFNVTSDIFSVKMKAMACLLNCQQAACTGWILGSEHGVIDSVDSYKDIDPDVQLQIVRISAVSMYKKISVIGKK